MARISRAGLAVAGCAVMAYGAWGLFLSHQVGHRTAVVVWLTAGLLGHDAVLAPAVFMLCWAGAHLLPSKAIPWAAGAALAGGSALFVALPAVLRKGHGHNPTLLPLDYARNTVIVLAVIVLAAVVGAGAAAASGAARRHMAAGREKARNRQ